APQTGTHSTCRAVVGEKKARGNWRAQIHAPGDVHSPASPSAGQRGTGIVPTRAPGFLARRLRLIAESLRPSPGATQHKGRCWNNLSMAESLGTAPRFLGSGGNSFKPGRCKGSKEVPDALVLRGHDGGIART